MCSLHLTHPSGAVGSRHCGAQGAVFEGSVPCSPQSWTLPAGAEPWTFKMSFELSAFANYVTYICKNLSLSLSLYVCVMSTLHIVMHLFSVHIICQNLKKCPGHLCHTCVCVYACSMLHLCSRSRPLYKCKTFQIYTGCTTFFDK